MSTDQLTETPVAGTSRADYAKFVAAARWLRANGWNVNGDNRAARLGISIGETAYGRTYLDVKALTEYGNWANDILSTRPTSVQQAIDFLVVAGILPAEFASWAPKRDEQPVLLDRHGWRWYRTATGEYLEMLTSVVWSRDRLEADRGPLEAVSP